MVALRQDLNLITILKNPQTDTTLSLIFSLHGRSLVEDDGHGVDDGSVEALTRGGATRTRRRVVVVVEGQGCGVEVAESEVPACVKEEESDEEDDREENE